MRAARYGVFAVFGVGIVLALLDVPGWVEWLAAGVALTLAVVAWGCVHMELRALRSNVPPASRTWATSVATSTTGTADRPAVAPHPNGAPPLMSARSNGPTDSRAEPAVDPARTE